MGLELGSFKFGAAEYPLTESTTNSLLEDADPAIFHALAFISATFETYFAERLQAQALLHGLSLPRAVVSTLGLEPSPYLLSNQFQFPILALWRSKDVWDNHTIAYDRCSSVWEFSYILPPLNPLQAAALQPILRSASVTLRRVIHMGFDPGYQDGEVVWSTAGIQKAQLVECVYGGWAKLESNDNYYRALTGTIAVLEREMPLTSEYDDFAGGDVEIDLKSTDGTTIEPFDDFNTYAAPTLTSIDVDEGTANGNTLVTLTGTGFRVGTRPIITFDGAAADAVIVVNTTTVTCRTPAHAAYPTFVSSITLTAADGQSDTLDDAYTFTTA